jgi:tRNA dimethylallyltransferase
MTTIGFETPGVWLIAGPTASGKSALGVALACELGGEIVNADAIQLYSDLSILTARPDEDELSQAPHHLYGVADAADGWSVGRWLRAAEQVIGQIHARGRPAVVVGGTGLYFRALTHGLAEAPPVPEAVRKVARAMYEEEGEAAIRLRLASLDPAAVLRIAPNDRQRLVRALEVVVATGRALSDWQADTQPTLPMGSWRGLVLSPDRDALYGRCDLRVDRMIAMGALDEVRALSARRLAPDLPALKAVGYRELAAHLRGDIGLDDALAQSKMETRRYAKRQSTWFRNQTSDWPRIDSLDPAEQWTAWRAINGASNGV